MRPLYTTTLNTTVAFIGRPLQLLAETEDNGSFCSVLLESGIVKVLNSIICEFMETLGTTKLLTNCFTFLQNKLGHFPGYVWMDEALQIGPHFRDISSSTYSQRLDQRPDVWHLLFFFKSREYTKTGNEYLGDSSPKFGMCDNVQCNNVSATLKREIPHVMHTPSLDMVCHMFDYRVEKVKITITPVQIFLDMYSEIYGPTLAVSEKRWLDLIVALVTVGNRVKPHIISVRFRSSAIHDGLRLIADAI
ncbi:hypothetical protein B0H10DRAFT_1953689 [Mycena sp. CBHHK59/15]|nr:hypothetical protein B0H10DRAFT_1953689 [Mycena sp. CBHHK59/15]